MPPAPPLPPSGPWKNPLSIHQSTRPRTMVLWHGYYERLLITLTLLISDCSQYEEYEWLFSVLLVITFKFKASIALRSDWDLYYFLIAWFIINLKVVLKCKCFASLILARAWSSKDEYIWRNWWILSWCCYDHQLPHEDVVFLNDLLQKYV